MDAADSVRKLKDLKTSQGKFRNAWIRALSAWGTIAEDIADARVERAAFIVSGRRYLAAWCRGGIREERYTLMTKGKGGLPEVGKNCILCAKLRVLESLPHGVLSAMPEGVVVPNKYPGVVGHSLYIPRSHNSLASDERDWKAAIPSEAMLLEMVHFSDRYEMVACRNHPRDGMSIPDHDHIHMYPAHAGLFPVVKQASRAPDGFLSSQYTPFSTYKISSSSRDRLVRILVEILKKCDERRQVVTFVYHQGSFFLTVRLPGDMPRLQIGGGVSGHKFNPFDKELMDQILHWIPRREQGCVHAPGTLWNVGRITRPRT